MRITFNCFYSQWNLNETPKSWEGLLVKIQFKCYDTNGETKHCVVIKYTGTFKGKGPSIKTPISEVTCKTILRKTLNPTLSWTNVSIGFDEDDDNNVDGMEY